MGRKGNRGGQHDRHQIEQLRGRVDLADDRRPPAKRAEPEPVDERAQRDQDVARDRRRGHPPGHQAEPRRLDEHRHQQQLVGRRIENLAELGNPVESLGQVAIQAVGDRRQHEESQRQAVAAAIESRGDRPDERQAHEADEVGQVTHDSERAASACDSAYLARPVTIDERAASPSAGRRHAREARRARQRPIDGGAAAAYCQIKQDGVAADLSDVRRAHAGNGAEHQLDVGVIPRLDTPSISTSVWPGALATAAPAGGASSIDGIVDPRGQRTGPALSREISIEPPLPGRRQSGRGERRRGRAADCAVPGCAAAGGGAPAAS